MPSVIELSPCTGCDCPNHFLLTSLYHDTSPHSIDYASAKADVAHLKFSNEAPTEEEADTLRTIVSSCERRMDCIDEEESVLMKTILDMEQIIATSKQRMLALRQERLQIPAEILIWKSLLSPIRHVPPEVWIQIFRHTIEPSKSLQAAWGTPTTFANHGWDFHPPEDSLWAIEGVCSKWRNVLLNSPSVCSNFGVNANRYVRKLGRRMDRSGNHSLTITISTPKSRLVMMLHSFSRRIQYLRFNLPSRLLQSIPSLQLSLPSLHTLFLLSTDGNGIARRSDSFAFCPSLRNLACVDIIDPNTLASAASDVSIHIHMLERLVNLRFCQLIAPLSHNAVFPSLYRNYRRTTMEPLTVMPQIMDRLTLPQLLKLDIVCPFHSAEFDITFSAACGLIHRSLPPLTQLCFMRGYIDSADLLHIIRTTPTLEELKLSQLNRDAITPEIIAALTLNHSGDINMPRLHTIRLSNAEQVGLPQLVDMIRSRWILEEGCSDVTRLRSVEIIGDSSRLVHYTRIKYSLRSTFVDIDQWIRDGLRCEIYDTLISCDNW
ncbi:uncharacterized protein EV420DRAFT_1573743 [Desarmillaria tabescens]|uniref:F-box domain-containing protein n=1 Tax=Armillaria tabescens TaxID=1929756 RepID=A0AA39JKU4_ARMTA|nr:uncharacterized protein EV420DRAFT_1573743 [Desarmillaria tabescens]KAK0444592.1 hypothetical protein EV420DRAFT_1573743 [Desarmillaria tabescens]